MDVIYANAVSYARQSKLLDAEKLARMTDAQSPQEAYKICQEVGFGADAHDLPSALAAEDKALAEFVRGYAPSDRLRRFLLAEYDFHNAEVLVKSKHLSLDVSDYLRADGEFGVQEMKECVSREDYVSYPTALRQALEAAESAFAAGTDGVTVGAIFARGRALYQCANADARWLKKLLAYRIDTQNIQISARARNFSAAERMLLPGGSLKSFTLKKVAESSPETIAAEFRLTPYQEFADSMAEAINAGKPFVQAERLAASYEVAYLKDRRLEPRGAMPFVLYVFYKINEMANVRIIAAGINNGLDRAAIKERLRDGYEG